MRMRKAILVVVLGLFCYLSVVVVQAEETMDELPVIVRWEDGKGYDRNDQILMNTWAYDEVNSTGKYVQFQEDGSVLQKCESLGGGHIEENFTSTELETAKIALRVEGFQGFKGIVRVTIEEKSGITKQYTLTPDNLYEWNADVNSGAYKVVGAEAYDNHFVYETAYSPESYTLAEKAVLLVKIKVLEEQIGNMAKKTQAEESKVTKEQENKRNGLDEDTETKAEISNYMLLFTGVLAAVLFVWFILRSKKKRYY